MDRPSLKDLILIKKIDIISTREQIQEDVITLMDGCYGLTHDDLADKLCQIVVDNFNKNLGHEFDKQRATIGE